MAKGEFRSAVIADADIARFRAETHEEIWPALISKDETAAAVQPDPIDTEPVKVKVPEREPTLSYDVLPKEAEKKIFADKVGNQIVVRKTGDDSYAYQYKGYEGPGKDQGKGTYTGKEMLLYLEDKRWMAVGEKPQEKTEKKTEVPPLPEKVAVSPGKPPERIPDARIEALRKDMEVARGNYVRCDVENSRAMNLLKRILPKALGGAPGSSDIEKWKELYKATLNNLKNAELEAIRNSGLEGRALKGALVGVVHYYVVSEPAELIRERDEQKLNGMKWPEMVLNKFGAIGEEYSKLSFREKMEIAAVAWGTAIVASPLPILLRQFLAGAGTAYAVRAFTTRYFEKGRVKEEKEKETSYLSQEDTPDVGALSRRLENDILRRDRMLSRKKLERILAQTLGLGAGAAIFIGMPGSMFREIKDYVMEKAGGAISFVGGAEAATAPPETVRVPAATPPIPAAPESIVPGAPAAPPAVSETSAVTVSPDAVATASETPPSQPANPSSASASEASNNDLISEPPAPSESTFSTDLISEPPGSEPLYPSAEGILEDHTWKSGENMWKFLSQQLGSVEGKDQKIQSILNVIQEKANGMTPQELKDAGFRSGRVGMVYAGETFQMHTFITPEKLEAIMNGEVVPGRAGALPDATVSDIETRSPDRIAILQEHQAALEEANASREDVSADAADTLVSVKDETQSETPVSSYLSTAAEGVSASELKLLNINPYTFAVEYPDLKETFYENVKKHLEKIFQTKDFAGNPHYDYNTNKALGHTLVSDVVGGESTALEEKQVKSFKRFFKAAGKALGPLSNAKAGETLNQYIGRMDATALLLQKKLP